MTTSYSFLQGIIQVNLVSALASFVISATKVRRKVQLFTLFSKKVSISFASSAKSPTFALAKAKSHSDGGVAQLVRASDS